MIEIRCDKCGNCIGVGWIRKIGEPGLEWVTINECHCPRCHPENVNVKEDPDNEIN